VPDAAEALRKTSVLEEAEDLRTVLTRTGSPDLLRPVAALEAEAEAREEDRPKTAPGGPGPPGLPGDDLAALRGPGPAMRPLPGVVEVEVVGEGEVAVEAELTGTIRSPTSAWESSD